MNKTLPALMRIPLFLFLSLSLVLCGVDFPVLADTEGPVIKLIQVPYPLWFQNARGQQDQDGFKFGDMHYVSVVLTDDAAITSVVGDLSELGIVEPVSLPFVQNGNNDEKVYRITSTINSHGDGPATVRIIVTDALGRTATGTTVVKLDNTPPEVTIDAPSFATTTAAPALDDTVLVSGVIAPNESKAFVIDAYYTLYDVNGKKVFADGSFQGSTVGVSLSPLEIGPFTNFPVKLSRDFEDAFRLPDAAYISITASVLDGATNKTTVTSPLASIPTGTSGVPTTTPASGMSNVLFLPGIEGSRLYEPAGDCDPSRTNCIEHKLWDPSSDSDLADLALDAQGKSMRSVYTKEGDSIDSVGPFKFYSSFVEQMNSLKNTGTLTDWQIVTYDWRLSLDDLISNGSQHGSHINYGEATSSPYIEQTLRSLAARSKTGKVTIIAHSNGGLVAKALMQKLGSAETARLVDKVIFVGVPQSGTPQALAGALHGYGAALPADWCSAWAGLGSFCAKDASRMQSRTLAENLPMIYDLLPSSAYFADVQDALHPVVTFATEHLFAKERSSYGFTIQNENELIRFVTDEDEGRSKPVPTDLTTPNILNANLLALANESHSSLDTWTPPSSVSVYQIAGWGADTLSGIEYYEAKKTSAPGGYVSRYRPQFVEDGDSTVTIPSALMMPLAENATRYWVNLTKLIALQPLGGATHANLLEVSGVRTFIQNILSNSSSSLPDAITTTQPADINPRKKLLFTLHGTARATLRNSSGQSSIINADGTTEQGIPNVIAGVFGDTHYLLAPVGEFYQLLLDNADQGFVDVDVQQTDGTTTETFEDIPVSTTQSTLDISADGTATTTPLSTNTTTSTIPVSSGTSGSSSSVPTSRTIQTSHTKGIHTSQSVLTPPKPIPVPKPPVVKVPKVVTPKAKPLTKKAKATLSALLNQLTAQLQGLLTKLPH